MDSSVWGACQGLMQPQREGTSWKPTEALVQKPWLKIGEFPFSGLCMKTNTYVSYQYHVHRIKALPSSSRPPPPPIAYTERYLQFLERKNSASKEGQPPAPPLQRPIAALWRGTNTLLGFPVTSSTLPRPPKNHPRRRAHGHRHSSRSSLITLACTTFWGKKRVPERHAARYLLRNTCTLFAASRESSSSVFTNTRTQK